MRLWYFKLSLVVIQLKITLSFSGGNFCENQWCPNFGKEFDCFFLSRLSKTDSTNIIIQFPLTHCFIYILVGNNTVKIIFLFLKFLEMTKQILKKLKPLSKGMEEQLMELHERDLLGIEPTFDGLSRTCKSLHNRGLVGLKEFCVNEKSFHGYYITSLGIYYLSEKCKSSIP
ncbi:MAG: hypothetical protein ABJA71_02610 [Ginsengibacter sp.]